jgi:hypothetical protein
VDGEIKKAKTKFNVLVLSGNRQKNPASPKKNQ